MNKIIFTADDFGVVPSINNGIIDMVNRGIINSVEIFPNYHQSVENTIDLLDKTTGMEIELGVHLTITSGGPLSSNSALKPILDDQGLFRKFSNTNSNASGTAIYNELVAQIEALRSNPRIQEKLTHLTNHHDALWFFPEYTKQLIRVSKEFGLPVRNPKSYPPKRDKFYYSIILPALKVFSLSLDDILLLRKTYKQRKNGRFPNENLNYRAPKYMDSRYYGPIPNKEIDKDQKGKKIEKKIEVFEKMLTKAIHSGGQNNDLIEFMFHLRKGTLDGGHDAFYDEIKGLSYDGINPHYFDSRTIEFEALRFYEPQLKSLFNQSKIGHGSWRDSKLHTLRKI